MISFNRIFSSTQVLDQTAVLGAMEHSLAMIELDPEGNVLWSTTCLPSPWVISLQK
ncbi:hypothetical protein [Paenibacillus pinistramenti]|uniref:hypothetical protein n=1 Tax=Paenibacillus pinistramenti TaxID=1768003 RepID=UPI001EF12429|nr:hypothetical protein [Paenibacillus pinistramenti]